MGRNRRDDRGAAEGLSAAERDYADAAHAARAPRSPENRALTLGLPKGGLLHLLFSGGRSLEFQALPPDLFPVAHASDALAGAA